MKYFGFWPNPTQELLLTAALADGETARRAWAAWCSRERLETADLGSQRLAPLACYNLGRAGLADSAMTGLQAGFLRSRLANRLQFWRLSQVLEAMREAGIPVLLLKGSALALQVYPDPALRPMADLDIAAPHAQAREALAHLQAIGWSPAAESIPPGGIEPDQIKALTLIHPDGGQLDLHFSLYLDCAAWASMAPLWQHATTLRFEGRSVLTLSRTDHLLHALVHGAKANLVSPIRWVADAVWILRGEQAIDWDRFIAQARSGRFSVIVSRSLAYLDGKFGVSIPADVIMALEQRASLAERLEYGARRDSARAPRLAERLANLWVRYRRRRPDAGPMALVVGLPRHLKTFWAARDLADVARLALVKTARATGLARPRQPERN
jgi:hypothetical protein